MRTKQRAAVGNLKATPDRYIVVAPSKIPKKRPEMRTFVGETISGEKETEGDFCQLSPTENTSSPATTTTSGRLEPIAVASSGNVNR